VRRLLVAIAAWALLLSAAAEAARLPVYRDPPKYKGRTKAPATLPPPAPVPAPAAVLSETGFKPDVLVDEAGTAHIVWAEGNGDGADTEEYCRLKRGATTCDQRATLVWNKSYGTGDGPQYNTDYGGPRIVRVGNQLVVFSKRYPTIGEKPDGASSSTVIQWVSSDGGNSWNDNAQIAGKLDLGQLQVVGPEEDPSILNVTVDPLCSAPGPAAWCIQQFRSGQYSAAEGNLATGSNQNYYPGVALDETGRPIAVATDAGGNAFTRRWSGQGSPLDGSTWGPAGSWVADGPVIAGGQSGAWMMSKTTFNGGPFSVRRINVNGDGTVAPGPATDVSQNQSDIYAELFEDPSGALHAAWEQRAGDKPGVKLRSSTAAGWGPVQHLFDGDAAGAISVGAAADGGGFAAIDRNVGKSNSGVVAVGFGNQAATGVPGLGDIPGGAGTNTNVSCQKVGFGKFAVESPGGCLLEGSGKFANLVVSTQELTIQGLRIVPDPGVKVIIDPRKLQIDTTGPVQVIASNGQTSFVLWHGPIHRDLSRAVPGSNLFEFPSNAFKANLLGFDVAADVPVRLESDGVHIPIDLSLPPQFGGFTGHAELISNQSGLQLDTLNIHIGPVPLGVLIVDEVNIKYTAGDDTWTGNGKLRVPATGEIEAGFRFEGGDFAGASFGYTPEPAITIGPFVYLLHVDGSFEVKPNVKISAGALVGAGAPLNGRAPVDVDGRFTMTFPKLGPASFNIDGVVNMLLFRIGEGHLRFQTDGYADFFGKTGLNLGPLDISADLDGFIDGPSGRFGASLSGKVGFCAVFDLPIKGETRLCGYAKSEAAISNTGLAVCGRIDPPDPIGGVSGGVEFPWNDFNPLMLVNPTVFLGVLADHVRIPCHASDYRSPPPRPVGARASASGQIVAVKGGLPSETIQVVGDGGTPKVTVTGPGGVSFSSNQPTANGFVTTVEGVPSAYVVLKKPRGGDYTITANEGSPGIAAVKVADGYSPATVKATVKRGSVAYRISNGGSGQQIVFAEKGKVGTRIIGTAKGSRGRLRFKPAAGPGGKRTVVAMIQRAGFVTDTITVGSFKALGPAKPGAVRRLKAKHAGTVLTVTWAGAAKAARYSVIVRGSKGSRAARLVGSKTRKLRLTGMRRDEKFAVTVRALSKDMRAGAVRSAKSR
jgi:hypothetical protein